MFKESRRRVSDKDTWENMQPVGRKMVGNRKNKTLYITEEKGREINEVKEEIKQ
jgi:hypothetical protein